MKSIEEQTWFGARYAVCCAVVGLACACSAGAGAGTGSRPENGGNDSGGSSSASGGSGASSNGAAPGSAGSLIITDPSSGGSAGEASCASDSRAATDVPLAMYILLDQSGSMTLDGNRWAPVSTALKTFVSGASLAGVGVGLQYFPLGATTTSDPKICVDTNYATADVAVQDLPGSAAALTGSIDKHFFTSAQGNDPAHWGTPTYPALQGSYTNLRAYLTANPTRRGVLLLATDGLPSKLCMGDTSAEVTTLIASQAAMTPPIQTYVVGIGNVGNLNDWAMAGATGHAAFIVDGAGTTTQTDLAKALDEIRVLTLPCDYEIPAPTTGMIDPTKVNVRFTPSGQAAVNFLNVPNVAACATDAQTWYYDNAQTPTHVIMCPTACDALHQQGAKIEVVFGCKTEGYNPPK